MKFAYQFSQQCGTVYKCGNVVFTHDGNCLLSPVGNRVTVFDLVEYVSADTSIGAWPRQRRAHPFLLWLACLLACLLACSGRNATYTLPFENRKNIERIALSGGSRLLVSVDEGE